MCDSLPCTPSASASTAWAHHLMVPPNGDPCSSSCGDSTAFSPHREASTSLDAPPAGVTSDSLLEAISTGHLPALGAAAAACAAAGAWPLSPAACLVAAVKLRQEEAVAQMLAHGASPEMLVADLAEGERGVLGRAGISVDGICHMSPLVVAVRQQSLVVARMLLMCGAPAGTGLDGVPLLLHFHAAANAAAAASSGSCISSTTCSGARASGHDTASAGGASPYDRAFEAAGEEQMQLLWALLCSGADPLAAPLVPTAAPQNFLTGQCVAGSCLPALPARSPGACSHETTLPYSQHAL